MQYTKPFTASEYWDAYVGNQTESEFMEISRSGNPDITIEQAATEYAANIPSMFGQWHEVEDDEEGTITVEWSQDELDGIAYALATHLEQTRGETWDISEDDEDDEDDEDEA